MSRFILLGGLVLACFVQSGCRNACGKQGCGPTYWGAYADSPPSCDPCDCRGGWMGGGCGGGGCGFNGWGGRGCGNSCTSCDSCDSCYCDSSCGSPFPWKRAAAVRWSNLSCLFGRSKSCTSCCDTCSEPACGDPGCGEPACGDPGCGIGGVPGCSSCGGHSAPAVPMEVDSAMIDYRHGSMPTSAARRVQVKKVGYSYRAPTNVAALDSGAPSTCNCGRQH